MPRWKLVGAGSASVATSRRDSCALGAPGLTVEPSGVAHAGRVVAPTLLSPLAPLAGAVGSGAVGYGLYPLPYPE